MYVINPFVSKTIKMHKILFQAKQILAVWIRQKHFNTALTDSKLYIHVNPLVTSQFRLQHACRHTIAEVTECDPEQIST